MLKINVHNIIIQMMSLKSGVGSTSRDPNFHQERKRTRFSIFSKRVRPSSSSFPKKGSSSYLKVYEHTNRNTHTHTHIPVLYKTTRLIYIEVYLLQLISKSMEIHHSACSGTLI